jgi:hypothetical protein
LCNCCFKYYYFFSPQLENLERQTSRDAATITKLNSELRQVNSTQKENNSEIGKLQKEVKILVKIVPLQRMGKPPLAINCCLAWLLKISNVSTAKWLFLHIGDR